MAVPKDKKSITITLNKSVLAVLDKVIKVINEENAKKPLKEQEPKCTRTIFIQNLLLNLFTNLEDEQDTKGEIN